MRGPIDPELTEREELREEWLEYVRNKPFKAEEHTVGRYEDADWWLSKINKLFTERREWIKEEKKIGIGEYEDGYNKGLSKAQEILTLD